MLILASGNIVESLGESTSDLPGGLAELVVALDKPSALLEPAKKLIGETLGEIRAQAKALPQTKVLKSGRFVLWGDLFKTGGCFALVDLTSQRGGAPGFSGFAFAKWKDGKWELRGLWKVPTVWRSKGWQASEADYLPATPATQPFELLDLSGDGIPEVIVAGEVDRYFQQNYLFCFSSKANGLRLAATAMAKPETAGEYVRLYFNSGRRAIYEEWQFLKWDGDELVPVASWHDEDGYGTDDPTFSKGERTDRDGKSEVICVLYGKGQCNTDSYELTRDGKPFGRMRLKWKDETKLPFVDSDQIEKAWLFEKITGLPRRLYPSRGSVSFNSRLEDFASVAIQGNAEAVKLFSTVAK